MSGQMALRRVRAIAGKEVIQMLRDRMTLMMMVSLPILQLLLFGYAINTDPRHLPTAVELRDDGPAVRAILSAMEASDYFEITSFLPSKEAAQEALVRGQALFVLTVPDEFERDLAAGRRPQLLLDADATDPVATSAAAGAFGPIVTQATRRFAPAKQAEPMIGAAQGDGAQTIVHRRYNAAGKTALNIVPGLIGVILTMTMTLMTAIALTRERERGTLESLLASPAKPLEVMLGKTIPFIFLGVLQAALMVVFAYVLFDVPIEWDLAAFSLATGLFIMLNLCIGFLFSTLAQTQLQAMQMTFMSLMPSFLLSGFMFPFDGMPGWAQGIGYAIPNTYFISLVRAVVLKNASLIDVWPQLAGLAGLCILIMTISLKRYRTTLD